MILRYKQINLIPDRRQDLVIVIVNKKREPAELWTLGPSELMQEKRNGPTKEKRKERQVLRIC